MDKHEFQRGWYVAYTKPRHEKKVNKCLSENIRTYLPLVKIMKRWSDRKKLVEIPLFTSYIFVYLEDLYQYNWTLDINGISWYVKFSGKMVRVPEQEIEKIKYLIGHSREVQVIDSESDLKAGDTRRINFGPLAGIGCRIVRNDGREKVLVQIESLQQTVMVEIDSKYLTSIMSL